MNSFITWSKEVPTEDGLYLIKYRNRTYSLGIYDKSNGGYFKTVESMNSQISYVDCLTVEWAFVDIV